MKENLGDLQERLESSRKKFEQIQMERNELYQKKKSYISFDAMFALLGVTWYCASSVYGAIRGKNN